MNTRQHYCPDWDYMLIDGDSPEIDCCICDDDEEFLKRFIKAFEPSKMITYLYQDDKEKYWRHEDVEKPIYGKDWKLCHPMEKNWEFLYCKYNGWDSLRFRFLK